MILIKAWKVPIEIFNEASGTYSNQHWRAKNSRHKKQKAIIKLLLKDISSYQNKQITIKFIRISPRKLDCEDNLPYAFKWVKDSIADLLVPGLRPGIADGSKLITWEYAQEKGKPKEKAMIVEIYKQLNESG